jgi:hypothetical protein
MHTGSSWRRTVCTGLCKTGSGPKSRGFRPPGRNHRTMRSRVRNGDGAAAPEAGTVAVGGAGGRMVVARPKVVRHDARATACVEMFEKQGLARYSDSPPRHDRPAGQGRLPLGSASCSYDRRDGRRDRPAGCGSTRRQAREPFRLLDTQGVARMLGVSEEWVRDHAAELSAIRVGDGPRGVLRFDAVRVRAALDRRRLDRPHVEHPRRPGPRRRSAGVHAGAVPADVRDW